MRTLEVSGASLDDIRTFEYTCLGEVRILGALKHDCIVELYGHEISSKWITSENGNEHRVLQSSILMEHIKGGSLKVKFFLYSIYIESLCNINQNLLNGFIVLRVTLRSSPKLVSTMSPWI